MARGKKITREVERSIAEVYIRNQKMPAWWIKEEVQRTLKPPQPKNWPGLSSVQKILREIKKKHINGPKDVEWSLYTLAEYDIPADALQAVMNAYAVTIAWDLDPLTIREAQWVARLYKVIDEFQELTVAARLCAYNEMTNEATGQSFACSVDADIRRRALEGKPGLKYNITNGHCGFTILGGEIDDYLNFPSLPEE